MNNAWGYSVPPHIKQIYSLGQCSGQTRPQSQTASKIYLLLTMTDPPIHSLSWVDLKIWPFWVKPAQTFSNWAYPATCVSSEILRACSFRPDISHIKLHTWQEYDYARYLFIRAVWFSSNSHKLNHPNNALKHTQWHDMTQKTEEDQRLSDSYLNFRNGRFIIFLITLHTSVGNNDHKQWA